jgi:hypothetical protein
MPVSGLRGEEDATAPDAERFFSRTLALSHRGGGRQKDGDL